MDTTKKWTKLDKIGSIQEQLNNVRNSLRDGLITNDEANMQLLGIISELNKIAWQSN